MSTIRDITGLNETLVDHALLTETVDGEDDTRGPSLESSAQPCREEQLNSTYNMKVLTEEREFVKWIKDGGKTYTEFEIDNMLSEYHSIFDKLRQNHVAGVLESRNHYGSKFVEEDTRGFVPLKLQNYTEKDHIVIQHAILRDKCQYLVKTSRYTTELGKRIRDVSNLHALVMTYAEDDVTDETIGNMPTDLKSMTVDELKQANMKDFEVLEASFERKLAEVGMFSFNDDDVIALVDEHLANLRNASIRHCRRTKKLQKYLDDKKIEDISKCSDDEPEFDFETDWQLTDNI